MSDSEDRSYDFESTGLVAECDVVNHPEVTSLLGDMQLWINRCALAVRKKSRFYYARRICRVSNMVHCYLMIAGIGAIENVRSAIHTHKEAIKILDQCNGSEFDTCKVQISDRLDELEMVVSVYEFQHPAHGDGILD